MWGGVGKHKGKRKGQERIDRVFFFVHCANDVGPNPVRVQPVDRHPRHTKLLSRLWMAQALARFLFFLERGGGGGISPVPTHSAWVGGEVLHPHRPLPTHPTHG